MHMPRLYPKSEKIPLMERYFPLVSSVSSCIQRYPPRVMMPEISMDWFYCVKQPTPSPQSLLRKYFRISKSRPLVSRWCVCVCTPPTLLSSARQDPSPKPRPAFCLARMCVCRPQLPSLPHPKIRPPKPQLSRFSSVCALAIHYRWMIPNEIIIGYHGVYEDLTLMN